MIGSAARTVLRPMRPWLQPAIDRHTALVGSVIGVETLAPEVVLTYDDGPDRTGTAAVLAALERHGASATFFVLLTRARRDPAMLTDLRAAGHEIALHGLDHRRPTSFPTDLIRRRLADGRAELEDLAGVRVRWYRPPYGAQSPRSWAATRAVGLTTVMWSGTTWDWRPISQQERVRKALATAARPGSILLSHDAFADESDGAEPRGPAPQVDRGDLCDRVLTGLAERGLHGRSLEQALHTGHLRKAARFSR